METWTQEDLQEKERILSEVEFEIISDPAEIEKEFWDSEIDLLIEFHDINRGGTYDDDLGMCYFKNELGNVYHEMDELMEGYVAYRGALTKTELSDLLESVGFKKY